jgi:hypothetical protein
MSKPSANLTAAGVRVGQTFDAERFLALLWAMDEQLAEHGFPRFSPWWRSQIERFVRALAGRPGQLRQWIVRVGRRGGKSTSWCKFSIAWALHGPWSVPAGDRGVVAFVSLNRDEASQRLFTVGKMLDALGVQYERRADEIALVDRPALLKVFTCSIDAVGFTAILLIGDEVARWESRDTAANPAREVFGSLLPTLATQPYGFAVLSSSPWTRDDYHHEQFSRGDTDRSVASYSPSWVANPTLTEAATRSLADSDAEWRREFLAEPSDTVVQGWFGPCVDLCIDTGRTESEPLAGVDYVAGVDAAWKNDCFAVAIAHREKRDGRAVTVLDLVRAWKAPRGESLSVPVTVSDASEIIRRFNAPAYADQYAFMPLRELFIQQGVSISEEPWTATSKIQRFSTARTSMSSGDVRLPDVPELIAEFRAIQGKLLPSGGERLEAAFGKHDDRVHAAILALTKAIQMAPDLDERLPQPEPPAGTSEWHKARARALMTLAEQREIEQFARREAVGRQLHKRIGLDFPGDTENWRRLIGR